MPRRCKKISASAKLQTLNLYLRLQNSNEVGKELGIKGSTVRGRLRTLGIRTLPVGSRNVSVWDVNDPGYVASVRSRLVAEILGEGREGKRLPGICPSSRFHSTEQLLLTLKLCIELPTAGQVARKLGIARTTVRGRIRSLGFSLRPPGGGRDVRFEDVNDMQKVSATISRLESEVSLQSSG